MYIYRHTKAILYAQNCLARAEQVLQQVVDESQIASDSDPAQRASYLKNVHTTIVIALYNLAVEYEHLSEFGLALQFFRRAAAHNHECLGAEPHMTKVIAEGIGSV